MIEKGKECNEPTTTTHRTDGTLTGQLQEGYDSLHPVIQYVRVRTVVEG